MSMCKYGVLDVHLAARLARLARHPLRLRHRHHHPLAAQAAAAPRHHLGTSEHPQEDLLAFTLCCG